MYSTDGIFSFTEDDEEFFSACVHNKDGIIDALKFAANYIRSNPKDAEVAKLFDQLAEDVQMDRLTEVFGEKLYDTMKASYK